MDKHVNFKCLNCGRIHPVRRYMDKGLVAECFCKRTKSSYVPSITINMETLDDLIQVFDKARIEWAYDDIVWEKHRSHFTNELNDNVFVTKVFIKGELKTYLVYKRKDGFIGRFGSEYDITDIETFEQAKQACEQHYKDNR